MAKSKSKRGKSQKSKSQSRRGKRRKRSHHYAERVKSNATSGDMEALTSKVMQTYPEPLLKDFVISGKEIKCNPEDDLNKSRHLSFTYLASPLELIRFATNPFSLSLALTRTKPATQRIPATATTPEIPAKGASTTGWTVDSETKTFLLPNCELQTLFSKVSVYLDGNLMPDNITEFQSFYHRLNDIFRERAADDLPVIESTKQYEDAQEATLSREAWLNHSKTDTETEVRTYRGNFSGVFPLESQTKTTAALTGKKLHAAWLHPSVHIRVVLQRRDDYKSLLCLKSGKLAVARYNNAQAEDIDLKDVKINIKDMSLLIESWTPRDPNILKQYQNFNSQGYTSDFGSYLLHNIPANTSYWCQKFFITPETKVCYLIFATNGEVFFDASSKTLPNMSYAFPKSLTKVVMKINGQEVHAADGLHDIGDSASACYHPGNSAYVSWLYNSNIWHSRDPRTFFPVNMTSDFLPSCQALIFNTSNIDFGNSPGELEVTFHATKGGGLKQTYNAILFTTESREFICNKVGTDKYLWTSKSIK